MILKIKGIRKWRIYNDELNWIIQENRPKNKPPNDWVNRFHYTKFENLLNDLVTLGVNEKKLSDFRGILDRQKEIYAATRRLIQKLSDDLGIEGFQVSDIVGKLTPAKPKKKKARKPAKTKGKAKKKK